MELELLITEGTPENVIEHSKAVYKKAMSIATNFNKADCDLIKKGALLHDIGRSKSHGIDHAIIGAEIAKKHGYSQAVQTGMLWSHIFLERRIWGRASLPQ